MTDDKFKILFESTLFIAIISAVSYFVGYGYYFSYFSRLSIPLSSMNIQPIEYMTMSYLPIIVLSLIFGLSFEYWQIAPRNLKEALIGNCYFIVVFAIVIIAYWLDNENNFLLSSFFVLVLLLSIIYMIFISIRKVSFGYFVFNKASFSLKFLFIILTIGVLFIGASILGNYTAEKLIFEKGQTIEVQLYSKDKSNTNFQDKTFIFVSTRENNYYVLEKNATFPKYPKLYIISKDQIEMATLQVVNTKI